MSKQVDERVVSMQFDNSHFERNVQTTMSTLDKLKQKLNFSGASKGLDGVSKAASNVDMTGLGKAVDSVSMKFSSLQVMGVTALANITNSAVNAGKRIVSALTIDPIKTGLSEYETKINAVQVIKANTRGKNTMEDITKALDELNLYADKTIYNFAQMTSNIGKFTAQGLDVQQAAKAVQGLANLAAASGASAEDMARATYQMSQALGGTIKLIDWNSLRNANMATVDLKNTLIELARVHGIAIDKMIEDEGSFEYTLQKGWLTGEMFTEAMNIYSGVYSEAELKAKGFTDKQIANFMDLAKTAEEAATKVKTFTQLWSVMKESAQSGWGRTWELIIGDFDEASVLLTKISNFFTGEDGIITKMSNARNALLESALGKSFKKLAENITELMGPLGKTASTVKEAVNTVKDYGKVVDEIIGGSWGNGKSRWDKLTEAGYDWAHAQNLVNEKLGVSLRRTTNYKEAQAESAKTTAELSETEAKRIAQLAEMSDAQLKSLGYTDKQIEAFRELKEAADKIGLPLDEFISKIDEIDGRWLLINSFKNVGQSIVTVFKSIGDAWKGIFDSTQEEKAEAIFNIFSAMHKFSTIVLNAVTDNSDKLTRTFKGLFALLDIVATITSGPLKIGFEIISQILRIFNLDILDVTARIGDVIVKFRDWLDSVLDFSEIFDKLAPHIQSAAEAIRDWIDAFKNSNFVKTGKEIILGLAKGIKNGGKAIWNAMRGWVNALKKSEFIQAGKDVVLGLANGIKDGAKQVWDAIVNIGKTILDKIKGVLGIHSPSTEMYEVGQNTIQGFVNGLQNGAGAIWDFIKSIGTSIVSLFDGIDMSAVSSFFRLLSTTLPFSKISNVLSAFTGFLGSIGSSAAKNASDFVESGKAITSNIGTGISNGASAVWDAITNVCTKCVNIIKSIDFGKIFAGALGVGMLVVSKKALDVLEMFGAPLEGLGKLLGGVGGYFDDLGKSKLLNAKANKWKQLGKAILNIAIAIGILAAAIALLCKQDTGKLWSSVGAIAAIATILGALTIAVSKFTTVADIGKVSVPILAISGAILILSIAIQKLAQIEGDDIPRVLAMLAGMVVGLTLVVAAFGKFVTGKAAMSIHKAGSMLIKMSAALLIMVGVIKLASKLETADVLKGLAVIAGVELLFAGIIAVSHFAGAHSNKAGSMLLKMSAALLLMLAVIKIAAQTDGGELAKGLAVVAGIELLFAGIIAVSKLAGKNATKAGTMMLAMSGALLLTVFVIKEIAELSNGEIARGLGVVAAMEILFGALIAVSKLAGSEAHKAGSMLLAMSGALLIITGVLFLLSKMNPSGLGRALGIVTLLELLFGGLIAVTKLAQNCMGTLIVLTVAVGVLAAAIGVLSLMDQDDLMRAAGSLSAVMVAFAAIIAATHFVGQSKGLLKTIIPMIGVVAVLAGIVVALSLIDAESALPTVASLSLLLISLAAAMAIMSATGKTMSTSIGQIYAMVGVVALLAIIVGALAYLNVQPSIETALALSILLGAMSAVMILLNFVGPNAITGVGALAALTLVVGGLAAILGLMAHFDINPSIETVKSLSTLLLAMSGALVILGVVGMMGPAAFIGIGALATLIAGIGGLIVAIGALVTEFPKLETFLDTGIPILEKIGYAIGSFFGNIVGGFADGALAGIPEIGTHLSNFMTNVQPFIDGAKGIDESVKTGIETLVAAILGFTAADFISGRLSMMPGGSTLPEIGQSLSDFMTNLKPFLDGMAAVKPETLTGVKALAEAILVLTAADVIQGMTSWFAGESSISEFGAQLPQLGTHLSSFANNLGSFDESKATTISCAANAIKSMAEAANAIPNEGGWVAKLVGENSLATFGGYLPQLGTNLSAFATNLGTFDESKVATVTCAANAIKSIAEAADKIPNEGGWVAKLLGENSLATFGSQLPTLGTNLSAFATNLGTFDESKVTTVTCAANAIKAMAQAAGSIDGQSEWAKKLFGDNSLSTFGTQLASVGTNLSQFAENLGTFNEDKVATVKSAVSAIKAFTGLANADLKGAKKQLPDFGEKLGDFATDITSFCDNMPSADAITAAADSIKKLISAVSDVASANSEAASKFAKSMKTLGESGVKSFVSAISSNTAKSDAKKAGSTLATQVGEGIKSKHKDIKTAGTNAGEKAADGFGAQSVKDDAKSAGKDLGAGLVAGIEAKETAVYNAAYKLGQLAVQGEKDGQESQSPSKATKRAGKWLGEGLIIGMANISNKVYKSGSKLGENATASISSAMSAISRAIDMDVDTQPTIRPVVDLSEVKAGAGAISGLFDMTSSIGVVSNIRAISSMMNRRNQNGINDDVVSAIKDLKKALGNTTGDTYTFGNITYGDDSAVSDAVGDLVRAIRRERRT